MAEDIPPWETDPDAALVEAGRRLAEESEGGRLNLDNITALERFPDGLAARIDLTRIDADDTRIADLTRSPA